MSTKTMSTREFDNKMRKMSQSIKKDFLEKGLARKNQGFTKIECQKHAIDVCVVQYMSEEYITANPIQWWQCNYSVSEKFYCDNISYKIFIGLC